MFLIAGYCIKCYLCNGLEMKCTKADLEFDRNKNLKYCVEGMDRCMRTWTKKGDHKYVANECGNTTICEERKKACDHMNENTEDDCKFACCDKDECNAGSTLLVSVSWMIACLMLGLWHCWSHDVRVHELVLTCKLCRIKKVCLFLPPVLCKWFCAQIKVWLFLFNAWN